MKQIGIIVPAVVDPMLAEFNEAVYETAAVYGYDVIVITSTTLDYGHLIQSDHTIAAENIFSLIETVKLDGIIFLSRLFMNTQLIQKIAERIRNTGIPCIDTGGTSNGFESVHIPQKKAFYDMTAHIAEKHGCKKILFLGGFKGDVNSEERISGFTEAAKKYGLEYRIVYGDFFKDKAVTLGNEILSGKCEKPDAVVCANDIMAAFLCDTLEAGGLSVPDDIIITGYGAHPAILAHFPTITTISGHSQVLAKMSVHSLLNKLGEIILPFDEMLNMIYGASCGCVERETDEQVSQQVHAYLKMMFEPPELQKTHTTTNFIAQMTDIANLDDLIKSADMTANVIDGFRTLDICLCEDWAGNIQTPDEYRSEGYSAQSELVLSKYCSLPSRSHIRFFTENLIPALIMPHEPMLLYVLPIHYILRNYGYCVLSFFPGVHFRLTPFLVSWLDAFANGLRTLQKIMYTDYLRDLVERSSLHDTMTGLLSQKGLLQYLQTHMKTEQHFGILLLTISRLLAVPGKKSASISKSILQSELLLAGVLRLLDTTNLTTAHINEKTFAVVFPLQNIGTADSQAEQIITKIEAMMKKMQESADLTYLPELFHQCSKIETGTEEELIEKVGALEQGAQSADASKTIDLSMLRKLRKELHRDPGSDWNQTVMAKRMNISVSYLQKLYKRQFDISFMDDLVQARMKKAVTLLTTTDLRISEIAEQCGYRHATHFMRQFKAQMGVTPSEYRSKQNE